MHLLDTDVCVDLLRGRDEILQQVEPFEADGPLAVASMTVHELLEGAHRSEAIERNLETINAFLKAFEILPYDEDTARIAGRLAGDWRTRAVEGLKVHGNPSGVIPETSTRS